MLSYRHSYHAGNFADVLKHLCLLASLRYLQTKDKPFYYQDSHAGAGLYDVHSAPMQKNGEYQTGIGRLYPAMHSRPNCHPLLADYLDIIQSFNPPGQLDHYPGSILIAERLLRPGDLARATELHPKDFTRLQEQLASAANVQIYHQDAYQSLKALLPPPMRRGLILIDPSYELADEYEQILAGLAEAHKRFASATYALWYPVVLRKTTEQFIQRLVDQGYRDVLRLELGISPDTEGYGMTASGMLMIRPAYTLKASMQALLPELIERLAAPKGYYHIEQLVEE